jgi:hypothetical protein
MAWRSRLVLSALMVTGVGAASACGSSAATSSSAAGAGATSPAAVTSASAAGVPGQPLDSCSVLTATEASQLAGSTLTELTHQTTGAISFCVYGGTAGGGGAEAIIESVPGGGQAIVQSALQAAIAQAAKDSGGSTQSISGIGDEGLKEVNANDATVAFVKGSTLVAVTASSTTRDGASIETDLETLVRQIAGQV